MIVTIENCMVTVLDEATEVTETVGGQSFITHLEVCVLLSCFRKTFPDMPPLEAGFQQLSYEPENGLFHVARSGRLLAVDHPEQDYLLNWIHNHAAAIHAAGVEWRKNEIRGIANE